MAALLVAGLSAGAPATGQVVDPPGSWSSGDTHGHVNFLGNPVTLPGLWQDQQDLGIDMLWIQYWNPEFDTPSWFSTYAPLVTGAEMTPSQGDPLRVMQAGVEVSGFAASQFGHLQALAIHDAYFPDTFSTTPIMEHFDSQDGAVQGYAHVRWPLDYQLHAPASLKHFGSVFAPLEATLGLVDFLEVHLFDPTDAMDIRGMYYKLLNAGVRTALSGGSDNTIIHADVGGSRCYVDLGAAPLTGESWAAALAAGRSTVAMGPSVFLDLTVDGAGIGDELTLDAPGELDVTVTLLVADGVARAGTLDVVQDGAVVASMPYDLPDGGTTQLLTTVTVTESGWIAAASDDIAHTSAIYVIVEGRPITSDLDASYWSLIMTTLRDNLSLFQTGSEAGVITADLDRAVGIYDMLAALDVPPPPGVRRLGTSTPAGQGPIGIGVRGEPAEGNTDFALTCAHAPPSRAGVMMIGPSAVPEGFGMLGVTGYVFPLLATIPVVSDQGGYLTFPAPLPAGTEGIVFAVQFLWDKNPADGYGRSASDALEITIQPAGG